MSSCSDTSFAQNQSPSTSSLQNQCGAEQSNDDVVILSVFWYKGSLAAAYYSTENSEVHVMADIVDVQPDFHLTKSLYQLVQPTHLLVTSQVSDTFLLMLKDLTGADSVLHILPKKDYDFEGCRRHVLRARLPSEPQESCEEMHHLYLSTLLDLTSEAMVHALGVLLKWLDVSWTFLQLEQHNAAATIMTFTNFSLADMVMINSVTYEALQIFNKVAHPSSFKRGVPGSYKEGLSVYSIFNRCKSQLGSKCMRAMFLHPTRDIDVLNSRLDVVQFCMEPRNEDAVKNMLMCLKNIQSITRMLGRLTKLSVSVREWKCLHKTVYYCIVMGNICETIVSDAKLFREIADSMTEDIQKVEYCISRIIDFEESEIQNTFIVKLGVDEHLDRLKQKYGGMRELMSKVAQEELNHLPSYIRECNVVYIPEIGYLLALPAWKDNMIDEDWIVPNLDFMFKLESVGHYKNVRCHELDDVVGDTIVEISNHESRILLGLVQYIQERISPMQKIIKMASELDCLIALAMVAKENNYTRPTLMEEQVLDITGGRHPLQELCVDSYVPNDILSGDQQSLVKIITGPNASGKSVYLKQVALIAYLAHIGSFVPAESARIGILNHIHTRIQTVESVATNMSAFVVDLKQMLLSLCCSSPRSLIIVDEFGKGTTEIDGLALLTSCLNHFLSRGDKCPHVFASTHFHDVASFLLQSRYLSFHTLDYMADKNGEIIYLYKLKEGRIENSCALPIAESFLGPSTCDRADSIYAALKNAREIPLPSFSRRMLKKEKYVNLAKMIISSNIKDAEEITKKFMQ
ncbi:mutS protein homolog 5-like isoform X2 [Periplaneta americana]|uniref:mutS protein homolog 5-like isoform X2 n=1 Tax=Periplaneta americana TaxID=6978 RepID=UPI0037E8206B